MHCRRLRQKHEDVKCVLETQDAKRDLEAGLSNAGTIQLEERIDGDGESEENFQISKRESKNLRFIFSVERLRANGDVIPNPIAIESVCQSCWTMVQLPSQTLDANAPSTRLVA